MSEERPKYGRLQMFQGFYFFSISVDVADIEVIWKLKQPHCCNQDDNIGVNTIYEWQKKENKNPLTANIKNFACFTERAAVELLQGHFE